MDIVNFASIKWKYFLLNHKRDKNMFVVKKIYVDMAGDLNAGILLNQIVYWYMPNDKSLLTKLKVTKFDRNTNCFGYWLSKSKSDWWNEIRLTPRQIGRAINILREKGLIRTEVHKFSNIPTLHYQLTDEFFESYTRQTDIK